MKRKVGVTPTTVGQLRMWKFSAVWLLPLPRTVAKVIETITRGNTFSRGECRGYQVAQAAGIHGGM